MAVTDTEEVTKYNASEVRKKDAEKKQVEALRSTAFGKFFIDPKTGKPNRALAAFLIAGIIVGAVVCEWYAVINDWPKVRRIFGFFYVTYGFPIGVFGGIAVGLACYGIYKCFRR